MPSYMEGKAAIVTGASAGLGAGIALELTARGARVLMCSRSGDRLRAAAEWIADEVGRQGPAPGVGSWHRPATVAGDVTDPETAPALAAAALEEFGRLDILVCNAGGPPPGDFDEIDDDAWTGAFGLILLSVVRMIRANLPLLRESNSGRIVLTSSISGIRPVPCLLLSNTLRPALMGLARHLAVELARDDILINAVASGFFDTERSREVQEAIAQKMGKELREIQTQTTSRIPLKRQGEPLELGRLVSFLASEENTYITGQTVVIDGGLLIAG